MQPNARILPDLPPLDTLRRVHIIGLCGTAMGTLGAMFAERGLRVTGSDRMAYPPMSDWLAARGLPILEGYDAAHVPPDVDLVVVGNVARRDNPEAVEALRRGLPCLSLPEALRVFFLRDRRGLVVSGTHGKTTTSAMLAHLLADGDLDPSFFIGGVTRRWDSNYHLGGGDAFVIEGDEYDTAYFDKVPKLWHYPAWAAVINNVEFDHADIYDDLNAIRHAFTVFADRVDPRGDLWVNGDDPVARACAQDSWARVRTFGLDGEHELRASVRGEDADGLHVDVRLGSDAAIPATLPTFGLHNLRNFLGAAGLALSAGVPLARSCASIATFTGVVRRQELRGDIGGVRVYDDFAHHPTAVRETLAALRRRFPAARLRVAFEAKSNTSRRAIFQHDYPPAFACADEVIVSDPWKTDNLPESERLSVERLVEDIAARGIDAHRIGDVDAIVEHLVDGAAPGDLLVTLSGSNFGGLAGRLVAALEQRDPSRVP